MTHASEVRELIRKHVSSIRNLKDDGAVKVIDSIIEKEQPLLKYELAYELYDQFVLNVVKRTKANARKATPPEKSVYLEPYYVTAEKRKNLGDMNKLELVQAAKEYRSRAEMDMVTAMLLDQIARRLPNGKTVKDVMKPKEVEDLISEITRRGDARRILGEPRGTARSGTEAPRGPGEPSTSS